MLSSDVESNPILYLSGDNLPYDQEFKTGDKGTITANFIIIADSLDTQSGERHCTLQISNISVNKKKESLDDSADRAAEDIFVKTHISPAP